MTTKVSNQEFSLIQTFIESQCGIFLGENKKYLIENRLSPFLKKSGCTSFGQFFQKLNNPILNRDLINDVIEAVTTNETLWFRDQVPFDILGEKLLPKYQARIKQSTCSEIKIWSAACSTGQEPYSIAMTVHSFFLRSDLEETCCRQVKIVASDISEKILNKAFDSLGHYDTVIGPSEDGGYYLFGFRKNTFNKDCFKGVKWSTETVLKETLEIIEKNSMSSFLLPELNDIDTEDDLINLCDRIQKGLKTGKKTETILRKAGVGKGIGVSPFVLGRFDNLGFNKKT